jgi:hypothetical protein
MNDLIAFAEKILARYDNNEFRIDAEKAVGISLLYTRSVSSPTGEVKGQEKATTTLTDMWTNAVSFYRQRRGRYPEWFEGASRMVHAYDTLKDHDCLRDGFSVETRLQSMRNQIEELQNRLKATETKLSDTEKRFSDCREANIGYEIKLAQYLSEKDTQRQNDIKEDWTQQSTVKPDKEDE